MLMLLEAWDGITLSRNVAFSKQKMIIENRPHDPKTYQFPRPPDTFPLKQQPYIQIIQTSVSEEWVWVSIPIASIIVL